MKNNLEKSNKLPYNCYVDNKGYVMPKSVVIHNTKEVADWIDFNKDPQFNRLFNSGNNPSSSKLYKADEPCSYLDYLILKLV